MNKKSFKVKNCITSEEKTISFDLDKLVTKDKVFVTTTCPDGFTYNPTNKLCEKIESITPTINPGGLKVVGTGDDYTSHGSAGMKLYQNLTSSQIPIIDFIDALGNNQLTLADSYSLNEAYGLNGRMDINQVENVGYEWRGFSKCLEVEETKTYYLGIAANNYCRFKINGTLIYSLNQFITANFVFWHIIPIQLDAGINIIEMEGRDAGAGQGDGGAFACEIYDCPRSVLENATLNSDIDPYVLFGSSEMVGNVFHTGSVDTGYSCPEGYSINLCEDPEVCTSIQRIAPIVTNKTLILKESPCDCWLVLEELETPVDEEEIGLKKQFDNCASCVKSLRVVKEQVDESYIPEEKELPCNTIIIGEKNPYFNHSVLAQAYVNIHSKVIKKAEKDKFGNTVVGLLHKFQPGDIINNKYFVRKWVSFIPTGGHMLEVERVDRNRMSLFDLDQLRDKVKIKITGKVR